MPRIILEHAPFRINVLECPFTPKYRCRDKYRAIEGRAMLFILTQIGEARCFSDNVNPGILPCLPVLENMIRYWVGMDIRLVCPIIGILCKIGAEGKV
nr:MAG: hypothetical protein BECKMB1821G_GA0114241_10329 [Candidatus Kentron sp. MB]